MEGGFFEITVLEQEKSGFHAARDLAIQDFRGSTLSTILAFREGVDPR